MADPIAAPCALVILTLKFEEDTLKTELKEGNITCCNLTWMMSKAWLTGTDVNRAFTSYEGMHSYCCDWMDLTCLKKCCVFLIW